MTPLTWAPTVEDALSWEEERSLRVHKPCSAASVWVLEMVGRDGAGRLVTTKATHWSLFVFLITEIQAAAAL